jgi:hypothetical protein
MAKGTLRAASAPRKRESMPSRRQGLRARCEEPHLWNLRGSSFLRYMGPTVKVPQKRYIIGEQLLKNDHVLRALLEEVIEVVKSAASEGGVVLG